MLLYIMIIIAGVLLDQLTKWFGVIFLSGVTTLPIIPNVFHLTYVENTGAAFSLFSNMQLFLIVITIVFTTVLCYLLYILPKTKQYHTANLALSLIISGALGNLIDRIRLGYVVDFFDFRVVGFAIFNVADILVVTGGCLLAYALLRNQSLLTSGPSRDESKNLKTKSKAGRPNAVQAAETDAMGAEAERPRVQKDVLKDLKPKAPNERPIDITPDVRTQIIQLPSTSSRTRIQFEPTPTEGYVFQPEPEDPPVKIYHPKHSRGEGVESNTDVISVEEINRQLKEGDSIIIKHKNRYSERSLQYEESVRKQRANTPPRNRPTQRYGEEIEHYAQSVQERSEPNQSKRRKSQTSEWTPVKQEESHSSSGSPTAESIWASTPTKRSSRRNQDNYSDAASFQGSNMRKKKKSPAAMPETPQWEPVRRKTRAEANYTNSEATDHSQQSENSDSGIITDATPNRKNRYTDSTDSYIESIKKASKKHYTE